MAISTFRRRGMFKPKHLPHLDGLRGLASMIILFSHCLSAWLPALAFGQPDLRVPELVPFAHTPLAILWSGDTAVMIFFIISGFVLAEGCQGRPLAGEFGARMLKRVARLGIPVGAAILFTGALLRFGGIHNQQAGAVSRSKWLVAFYLPEHRPGLLWSAAGGSLVRGSDWWIGPLWSTHVQFFGSLLVFALIALFGNDRWANLVFGCVVVWALVGGSSRFGIHFGAIVSGVLLSRLRSTPTHRAGLGQGRLAHFRRPSKLVSVLVGVVVVVYFGSWPDETVVGSWYEPVARLFGFTHDYLRPRWFAHTAAALTIVWFVLTKKSLQRVLQNKVFVHTGRLSFAIYLVHWPILMSLGAFVFARVAAAASSLYLGAAVASSVTLVATVVTAVAFRAMVEVPAQRLGNWLAELWNAPNRSPATVLEPQASPEFGNGLQA
jgi:peptidoglycan/LPS O-acetylase OafA/YrhL